MKKKNICLIYDISSNPFSNILKNSSITTSTGIGIDIGATAVSGALIIIFSTIVPSGIIFQEVL